METVTLQNQVKKPIALRIIMVSFLLKVFIAFGLYFAISNGKLDIPNAKPDYILYTAVLYIINLIGMIVSALNGKLQLFRAIIIFDFIISIPAKAVIGFVVAVYSFGLTFHPKVKEFFESKRSI
ncbi:hypothetical protein MY04_4664 [Flammeovirga sp. MY04]|uniref:hypothetical protein n=1 Tax=Flammeovirga sp. MY04 TaxID=1191459 RepID=UPI0008062015|nr:hypothetical protein [Flammeovirga sp. MY04]ANQ51999.1 hypothetical protein MY04_4664 [Flammeovirga sp. MY04]